jgi:MSHA biogenesis protein MshQ
VGKSDGTDILFTASDGTTKLDHELELYNSTTGQVIAWVRIPTLSASADTSIYIYYGNAAASNQQNPTEVWDTNFKLVQHLKESSGTTTADSTSNGNSGTKVSATSPSATTGQIDGAQSFNWSSDYIANTSASNLPALNGAQTVSAWLYYSSASSRSVAIGMPLNNTGSANASMDLELTGSGSGIGVLKWGGTALITTSAPSINTWHLITYTFDGTTNLLYVDGTQQASSTTAPNSGAPGMFRIGSFNSAYPTPSWSGKIDEVRVSNTNRSAGWIGTEFSNQNSPSTFVSVGVKQGP